MIANRIDTVPGRIARRASAAPDTTAVVDGDVRLTYGELDRRSDVLAVRLSEAGAGPGTCVGIYLNRSARFVVSALAVMKSGAAYVPLDPSTPSERVSAILAGAGAIALVTDRCDLLQPGPWTVVSAMVPDGARAQASPKAHIDGESLAYVIYTSGSTGEPKGVEITHANLANLVDWHTSAFAVTVGDRASQIASLGFDAAVWEIWPALAAGASLHIADEITRRSSQALFDWIATEKVTIGFVPTALAEQLLRMTWPADASLRVLLTGGDTLHAMPAAGSPFMLVNNYGPTECTVVATSGVVSPEGDASRPPSIGRPIANAIALILDESLEPVAAGAAGELCIGGALVGRGYRGQPELTARRFVTHRTATGGVVRLYRTGDRAALLEDGEIAFLGRLDDMVKIRGYRIEPGEIESWLNRFAGIEASAVAVRDAGDDGAALVAYLVLARDASPTAGEVREFLAARLPDYMVPAAFVAIPELPMTANGKVDKAALPASRENDLPLRRAPSGSAPGENGQLSASVSELVASMLGQSSIGSDENFFMAGGHSMLGAQLVAKIRDRFGVKLTLRQLFMAPTVAALSAQIAHLTKTA